MADPRLEALRRMIGGQRPGETVQQRQTSPIQGAAGAGALTRPSSAMRLGNSLTQRGAMPGAVAPTAATSRPVGPAFAPLTSGDRLRNRISGAGTAPNIIGPEATATAQAQGLASNPTQRHALRNPANLMPPNFTFLPAEMSRERAMSRPAEESFDISQSGIPTADFMAPTVSNLDDMATRPNGTPPDTFNERLNPEMQRTIQRETSTRGLNRFQPGGRFGNVAEMAIGPEGAGPQTRNMSQERLQGLLRGGPTAPRPMPRLPSGVPSVGGSQVQQTAQRQASGLSDEEYRQLFGG